MDNAPFANCEVVFLGTTKLSHANVDTINTFKQKYNLQDASPVLLSVGAIKYRKGQLEVVRSLPQLKKKYPNIQYVMIGSDRDSFYVGEINRYAEEHGLENNIIIIPDVHTDSDLAVFYELCDIFILVSNNQGDHFEGFGLVFLEAGQFGKPGIGSFGCGIEDAIKDGYNGYLIPQGDSGAIHDRIGKLLRDYETFSNNAIEFQAHFSWDKTIDRYLEIYNDAPK